MNNSQWLVFKRFSGNQVILVYPRLSESLCVDWFLQNYSGSNNIGYSFSMIKIQIWFAAKFKWGFKSLN